MIKKILDMVIIYRAYPGISKNQLTKNAKLVSVLTNITNKQASEAGGNFKIILDNLALSIKQMVVY